ncbi:NAD(P)H-dependent flavin oxidoreductase [Bdellovibrio sp. HCB274]|uniref:NAD(P)H-dependent flavin oxidoreductase n=1 Tax=Bdellovibrio sp. HCB274 TaxID=3394361 RepID=UPI0039B4487B
MRNRSSSLSQFFASNLPLILAPMAGGPTTPKLVAEVCNVGGLGSLAAPYLKPTEIEKQTAAIRQLTNKPFAINLFAPSVDPILSDAQITKALKQTRPYRQQFALSDPQVIPPFSENYNEQFTTVMKLKPAVLSFTFGLLPQEHIDQARSAGIYVIGTATTLAEAQQLEAAHVDAIVLQGTEAGGHRGIFDINASEPGIGTMDLIQQCAAKIQVPLIAAGGLMNGADIAKALEAGADAVQMGTAFLLCEEAGTSRPYREQLAKSRGSDTELTRAFSGRIARGIKNRFMSEMQEHPDAILPFPAQNVFSRDLRKASADNSSPDFISLWAGTGVSQIREMKAAELVKVLGEELRKH